MATNFASSVGEITEQLIDYHIARAKGGAGLIIVENTTVDYPRGTMGATQVRADQDRFIPGLNRLVEAVHDHGAKVALQINHSGGVADERKTRGIKPVAPSPVPPGKSPVIPKELTVKEISEIVDQFSSAALRAKKAGFDAIEVHGAHGYLIAQFLSPYTNKRTDAYGGDPSRRARFALEILKGIRHKVSIDYPIIFRLSGDEFIEGGRTLEESKTLASFLEKAGIDLLHVTAGAAKNNSKQVEPMSFPQGWKAYLAGEIKKELSIPVVAVGVIREPEIAEKILEEGQADFVAVGRGFIADPEWALKAAQGKKKEIRKCISCNICLRCRSVRDIPMRCTVNPFVGREIALTRMRRVSRPKKVIVVGGGPGGMEAARTAAWMGNRVVLYEKEKKLGGQLLLASRPPHKDKIKWFIDYLIEGLRDKVEVRLGVEADARLLEKMNPDVVILATGGTPIIPSLPGIHRQQVVTAHDLLRDAVVIREKEVIVVGGGMVGCETAEFLAENDNHITILEMLDDMALDCEPNTRDELIPRLEKYGVKMMTRTKLLKVLEDGVAADQGDGQEWVIAGDWIVLALGTRSQDAVLRELRGKCYKVHAVGDCKEPRGIQEAVYEGSRIAMQIGVN
jgi:2,4-dienoyl-CoA reductase-like NADH-dependent reductase (Old Yellow Enzyme family)/thioredoxin reductase